LNSIDSILERLKKSPQARAQFVESYVDKGIAYQIRALRDRQDLSQGHLAEMVGMNQNAISRLESPKRGRPTITTLKRLAGAFDVALVVRFVPFSQLAKWVSGTPFVDWGISTASLGVPNFDEELRERAFESGMVISPEIVPAAVRRTTIVNLALDTNTIRPTCRFFPNFARQEEPTSPYVLGVGTGQLNQFVFGDDSLEQVDQFNLFGEAPTKATYRMPDPMSFGLVLGNQIGAILEAGGYSNG